MYIQQFTADQYEDAFAILEGMEVFEQTNDGTTSIHRGQHPEHGELTLVMMSIGGSIMVTTGVKFIAAAA